MLAAVLVLAASAATTLAAPACAALYRFQWPGAGAPNSGFLAVSLSGYNQQTSWINDGERVFASTDYLRYIFPNWYYIGSSGPLQIQGYSKCLDAGLTPGNGTPLKVWECYDGLSQQQWTVANNMIQLSGTNLCVDVTDGDMSKTLQLWQCSPGNPNQVWNSIPQ